MPMSMGQLKEKEQTKTTENEQPVSQEESQSSAVSWK